MGQMSFAEFAASIARDATPPVELSPVLRALWYDAKGDWSKAHALSQEDSGKNGSWTHAYLHRKEGDAENAAYWYARAGRKAPGAEVTLAEEWQKIARELLGDAASV